MPTSTGANDLNDEKGVADTNGFHGRVAAYFKDLAELLETGDYSDLVVSCTDGTTFKVHKSIVCAHSKFFATACRPGVFKEGLEGRVDIEYAKTEVVRCMLEYLYTLNYPEGASDESAIIFHVKMYSAGDLFQIPSFKDLAKQKFEAQAEDMKNTADFLTAAQLAYESSLTSDRGLREVVVKVCAKNYDELESIDGFKQMMSVVGELGADICAGQAEKIRGLITKVGELGIVKETLTTHLAKWEGFEQHTCSACNVTSGMQKNLLTSKWDTVYSKTLFCEVGVLSFRAEKREANFSNGPDSILAFVKLKCLAVW
ncbi:hypothetical protein EJ08DRAFT_730382 [Tothia fuscella]|uniref:BTB domain-containing protein n=1 Tax=Tothia fuscella TaxID=1048955 RepID=A0A9P4P0Y0_9PEZI|nr:hypothetical protein EJ08DRAFT_730382 [Tothia fuscella]